MFLVIDNYDSFVHNLARYFQIAGQDTLIVRNDTRTIEDIKALNPEAIIISPGPCTPKEAGVSTEIIKTLGPNIPILGVCLGHQCIGEAYGYNIIQSPPSHGKQSEVFHDASNPLFTNIPNPMRVGRYHSLIIQDKPDGDLTSLAKLKDGTLMACAHKTHPVYGVQFHPESILTEQGQQMVDNFCQIVKDFRT